MGIRVQIGENDMVEDEPGIWSRGPTRPFGFLAVLARIPEEIAYLPVILRLFGTRAIWCCVFVGTAQTAIFTTAVRRIPSIVGIAKVCARSVEIANNLPGTHAQVQFCC